MAPANYAQLLISRAVGIAKIGLKDYPPARIV